MTLDLTIQQTFVYGTSINMSLRRGRAHRKCPCRIRHLPTLWGGGRRRDMGGSGDVVPFRAGDSKCGSESCGYHNSAKNVSCLRCGASQAGAAVLTDFGYPSPMDHTGLHTNIDSAALNSARLQPIIIAIAELCWASRYRRMAGSLLKLERDRRLPCTLTARVFNPPYSQYQSVLDLNMSQNGQQPAQLGE